MKRIGVVILTCVSGLALAGCDAVPKVSYKVAVGPDHEGYSKFKLRRSSIAVEDKRTVEGAVVKSREVTVSALAYEGSADPTYMIVPADGFGLTTHLKVVHVKDTSLLKELGTEVEDKRVQYIQQAGSIIGTMLALFAGATPAKTETVLDNIDVYDMIGKTPEADRKKQIVGAGDLKYSKMKYEVVIGAVGDDADGREAFLQKLGSNATSVLFYSACRDVRITFQELPGKVFGVRIADPTFVQTVALPAKGKITMHDGCGVDVESGKSEVVSDGKLLEETAKQIKAIVDANDTSKAAKK